MTVETSETARIGWRGDVFQTRIALTFFGGVSLAVYESGAAVEFFRLVTDREGIYRELRDKIGPVVVDIISGTSAGGLSAAFLANALINRSRSLDPLMKLWLEKADLDTLFRADTEEEPKSLLSGEKFLALIDEALREMIGSEVASEPYQEYLDLFITATSLEGDIRKFNLDKDNIEARSHQRVFRFRYRGNDCDIDEQRHNDFEPSRLHLLARAARASASFPVAFEPVLIKKEEFGTLSPELMEDCYHIDGGILDNKPIRLALDAIASRQADKQIDRRLFYVEPLPEEINPAAGGTPMAGASGETLKYLKPINVLYAAVKDLPSYQSITSALEEIASRNRELVELRRTLDHYEVLAAKTGDEGAATRILGRVRRMTGASEEMWGPAMATDKYHPSVDIPTQLFRAQEDGYLDLRLDRHFPSFFTECEAICGELKRRSEKKGEGYCPAQEEFYYLKHQILWSCDFEYHRRQYHYLKQVVRGLFARLDEGELFLDAEDLRHEIFLSLNRLRALFNRQEGAIYQMQQHARQHQAPELLPIEGLLTELRANLEILPMEKAKEAVVLFSSTVREIAGWSEIEQRWRFLAQLHQTAEIQLKIERDRFRNEKIIKRITPEIEHELTKGYSLLMAALHRFYYRDMIIYPMMRGSDMLASELQKIRVARFGPLNGDSYVKLSDVRHKLAGEEALRFGGFMDATWRGNDLIWGRLDAVENIFYQLLPKGRDDPLFQSCVEKEQRRIVREMRKKFNKGIVHPLEKQDPQGEPPHEDLLIGKQNLRHIPEEKKIRWLKLGIERLLRTIRVPGVRLPKWGQRRLMMWSRARLSNFFVAVLVRPRPAAFQLAGACMAFVFFVSLLGACVLSYWHHDPPALVGWTGDVIAILLLIFALLLSLIIATIANSIRIGLLKIDSPSDEDETGLT